jgi:hypothetical protein
MAPTGDLSYFSPVKSTWSTAIKMEISHPGRD